MADVVTEWVTVENIDSGQHLRLSFARDISTGGLVVGALLRSEVNGKQVNVDLSADEVKWLVSELGGYRG